MSLILHLTDIHFGKEQFLGDIKVKKTLADNSKIQRSQVYSNTLKAITRYLEANDLTLDAVIVSGDITIGNQESGFKMFDELINSLGSKRPENKNIVVLPGNHDVTWGLKDGDPNKYQLFIKYIRDAGYTTPYLDVVDEGKNPDIILNLDSGKVQIVPINTSHYCGSLSGFSDDAEWSKAKHLLESNSLTEIIKEIDKFRLHDISRVSPAQIDFIDSKIDKEDATVFKIAVTHHPISPVTINEEFKTFESITNLGSLRNFIFEKNFRMLLHGHKHNQSTFWDLVPDLTKSYNDLEDQLPLLIVSGSQLNETGTANDLCRLIEIKSNGLNSEVKLISIHSNQSPGKLKIADEKYYQYEKFHPNVNKIIAGLNVDEAYNGILNHFHDDTTLCTNLICEIHNPGDKIIIPKKYPVNQSISETADEWIEKLVKWWSKENSAIATVRYTHGSRIYKFGESKTDQVQTVIDALKSKPLSSKGIAVLFNPDTDGVSEIKKGPHFCLIQFFIKERNGAKNLDCIAYFRKQEMRHWWLVNVAEIIDLQNRLISEFNAQNNDDVKHIKNGVITTVAAIAYLGDAEARPLVVIPEIDLLFEQDRSGESNTLTNLAYSLFYDQIPYRSKNCELWLQLLDDMVPREIRDENGIPIAREGLQHLNQSISNLLKNQPTPAINDLYYQLERLWSANDEYSKQTLAGSKSKSYDDWKKKCTEIINVLKIKIDQIYNKPGKKSIVTKRKSIRKK